MDLDRSPLSRDNDSPSHYEIEEETDIEVGSTASYLDDAVLRALACLPQASYGACGAPPGVQLPPAPPIAPCNDGNVGKLTYVTAVFPANTFPLAVGASAHAIIRPDTGFKGERIIIPASFADRVSVDSVKVKNQEQLSTPALAAGQGVNGAAFLAANNDGAGRLSMLYCKETAKIDITVTNVSGAIINAPGGNIDIQGVAS